MKTELYETRLYAVLRNNAIHEDGTSVGEDDWYFCGWPCKSFEEAYVQLCTDSRKLRTFYGCDISSSDGAFGATRIYAVDPVCGFVRAEYIISPLDAWSGTRLVED